MSDSSVEYLALRGLSLLTDLLPARHRFGHWQRVIRLLRPRQPLRELRREAVAPAASRTALSTAVRETDVRCMIVAGELHNGGTETIVAALARGLPVFGLEAEVVCTSSGRIAEELRRDGIAVIEVPAMALQAHIESRKPDVIQLHRVDSRLMDPIVATDVPVVPVFHSVESYLPDSLWTRLAELSRRRSPFSIAVSGLVREFFAERLGSDVRVVVNGVAPERFAGPARDRERDRCAVGDAIGLRFDDDDRLVVALQRYSDQKNPAGLVSAFLLAAEQDPRLRLVMAGAPDNWLEYRRAEAVRRAHPCGDRVHLLGDSDAAVLLSAADVYAIDSFAEGGPISAVEAVAAGVPVVASEIGFVSELVAAAGGHGVVVPRANADFAEKSYRAQRIRAHQSNRAEFASGILAAAKLPRAAVSSRAVPAAFTEAAMIAGHAALLREAAAAR